MAADVLVLDMGGVEKEDFDLLALLVRGLKSALPLPIMKGAVQPSIPISARYAMPERLLPFPHDYAE